MEKWKDIKGYEGVYQVSDLGNVRRIGKHYNNHKLGNGYLKTGDNGRGYKFVNLCKNNCVKQHYIHRLVAETFILNNDNKLTVNHIDCDKSNNKVENLEWSTYAENNDYALKMMHKSGKNKRNNKASKKVIQYDLKGNFIKEYPSIREAQRQTKIFAINDMLRGKQKTAGGYIWKYK